MTRASDPFDTYLLRVFSMLMAERSVSRAAARLNQSQPAVSSALKKLREILGDDRRSPRPARDHRLVPEVHLAVRRGSAIAARAAAAAGHRRVVREEDAHDPLERGVRDLGVIMGERGVRAMLVSRSPLYQIEPRRLPMLSTDSPVLNPGGSSQRTLAGRASVWSDWKLTPPLFLLSVLTAPGGQ